MASPLQFDSYVYEVEEYKPLGRVKDEPGSKKLKVVQDDYQSQWDDDDPIDNFVPRCGEASI